MKVSVSVPATSANLGPGFDCLGVALACHNQFVFSPAEHLTIVAPGCPTLDCSRDNLAYQSFARLFQTLGLPVPSVHLEITASIPLARGLGSSATAIVGGLAAANAWLGTPWDRAQLLAEATRIEGHPDNVAPALLGGCQLSLITDGGVLCAAVPWPETICPVAVIPDFELSTAQARAVLPGDFSKADSIFNCTRVGLLVLALSQGRTDWLPLALQDRIHQPYRQTLVPGMADLIQQAPTLGAYGLVLSGAGPTLLVLTAPDRAEAIGDQLVTRWAEMGITAQAKVWPVDTLGTEVQCS